MRHYRDNDECVDVVLRSGNQYYLEYLREWDKCKSFDEKKDKFLEIFGELPRKIQALIDGGDNEDAEEELDDYFDQYASEDSNDLEKADWENLKVELPDGACKVLDDREDEYYKSYESCLKELLYNKNYDRTYTLYASKDRKHFIYKESSHDAPTGSAPVYIEFVTLDEEQEAYDNGLFVDSIKRRRLRYYR